MTEEAHEDDTFFEGMDETVVTEEKVIEGEVETTGETETKEDETDKTDESTKETETAPPADKEPALVPRAAMLDERHKRQRLEEENENLRGQIPKSNEAPDPYEDIDKYNEFMRNQWQTEQNATNARVQKENLNKSRGAMLEQHTDYNEMERIFEIMTTSDNSLIGKMLSSGNEAKFAYDTAKAYKESVMGKTEVKAEVTEPSETEIRNKSAVDAPSLATATSTASNTVQVEKEDSIDDVFADQW